MATFTIVAPNGASTHGDSSLLCVPPKWYDFVVFYMTNYAAHAATIMAEPGQSLQNTVYWTLTALFLPAAGLLRTLPFLVRRPGLAKDPLKQAALAGALCTVVKLEYQLPRSRKEFADLSKQFGKERRRNAERRRAKPSDLRTGRDPSFAGRSQDIFAGMHEQVPCFANFRNLSQKNKSVTEWFSSDIFGLGFLRRAMDTKIMGVCHLPPGYQLVFLPPDTPLKLLTTKPGEMKDAEWEKVVQTHVLPCSYSVPKLLVSLVQALYAISTLYETRGNQIDIYGYAAFGLTVAPYAIMSVVNIITNLVTPEYSSIFLVSGPGMIEAEADGGVFDNIVAEIDLDKREFPIPAFSAKYNHLLIRNGRKHSLPTALAFAVLTLLPLSVVGGLSKFQGNQSTTEQRAWTMAWLGMSMMMGFLGGIPSTGAEVAGRLPWLLACFVPAIGGMVIVGLQLREYGTCSSLDNVSVAA